MTLYVARDVALEKTAVCVMATDGTSIIERPVPSEAFAIAELLAALPERPERIGLEAGPLSEWLVRGLADAGFTAILMETRQVRAALSSMTVKTDRNEAVIGINYRPVPTFVGKLEYQQILDGTGKSDGAIWSSIARPSGALTPTRSSQATNVAGSPRWISTPSERRPR